MKTATANAERAWWAGLPLWAALLIMRDNPSLALRMTHWQRSALNPGDITLYTPTGTYWISRRYNAVL